MKITVTVVLDYDNRPGYAMAELDVQDALRGAFRRTTAKTGRRAPIVVRVRGRAYHADDATPRELVVQERFDARRFTRDERADLKDAGLL